jgi:tRNA A37 threonylcarbamoyladenosine synthetase subunit TsaC/SUA5/YrdC
MLLGLHGRALLGTTLIINEEALNDPQEIRALLEHQVAGVIDAGAATNTVTTVLDLTPMNHGLDPILVRQGAGSLANLGITVTDS